MSNFLKLNVMKNNYNIVNDNPMLSNKLNGKISYVLFSVLSFLVLPFLSNGQCTYTFNMTDSWGDGWNGNAVDITVGGALQHNNLTLPSGSS